MTLAAPYPVELLRVAKKVVWYDIPEETLADLATFLEQVTPENPQLSLVEFSGGRSST
jgi:hypothetical protein